MSNQMNDDTSGGKVVEQERSNLSLTCLRAYLPIVIRRSSREDRIWGQPGKRLSKRRITTYQRDHIIIFLTSQYLQLLHEATVAGLTDLLSETRHVYRSSPFN